MKLLFQMCKKDFSLSFVLKRFVFKKFVGINMKLAKSHDVIETVTQDISLKIMAPLCGNLSIPLSAFVKLSRRYIAVKFYYT